MVSFRLREPEHAALLALAERAGIGHSALARRIVEHYISEHAPRNRRGR
jgi:predicted DNA-binding protein